MKLPSTPSVATSCNCSLCRRVGGLWAYFEFGTVEIEGHPENTTEYVQGDKTLRTIRCQTCGCVTHWEPMEPTPGAKHGVHLGNFEPGLVASVRVRKFDGADSWKFLDEPNVSDHSSKANQDRFLSYLRHYESKDLGQIAEMFSEDITLRDWKICVTGKSEALAETKANFEAAQSLQIQPLHLYEASGSVAGELRILVDGNVELFVVDVVDFDDDGKIKAIRAFLGRGDE